MDLELGLNLLVIVAVICFQVSLFLKSRRLARTDHREECHEFQCRFSADIQQRAMRGLPPDWVRYQSEIDRTFEIADDRLRSHASAALAAGLGATILALILNLLIAQWSPLDWGPIDLVFGMGIALFGSLSGIFNNLYITLRLLPGLMIHHNQIGNDIEKELQKTSAENLPRELFGQTVRDELSSLTKTLQSEIANAFSTALTDLPRVVEGLGKQVDTLAEIVVSQGKSINTAILKLEDCARAVAKSGTELQPAAQTLAESTQSLITLPQNIQEVIEAGRSNWLESVREDQQKNVRQLIELQKQVEFLSQSREDRMLDATREMQGAVADVHHAVDRLPEQLADQVDRISGKLGIEFGREARDHINSLNDHLAAEREHLLKTIKEHEQVWSNNIDQIVSDLMEKLMGGINHELVGELRRVGEKMGDSIRLLPEVTRELRSSHRQWTASQKESLDGWTQASTRTRDAAESLLNADGQLKIAVASLAKSSEHLDRIAGRTAAFEMALRRSLQEVASQHREDLKPIFHEVARMMEELGDARNRLDGSFGELSEFLRQCIAALVRRRQPATSGAQI